MHSMLHQVKSKWGLKTRLYSFIYVALISKDDSSNLKVSILFAPYQTTKRHGEHI